MVTNGEQMVRRDDETGDSTVGSSSQWLVSMIDYWYSMYGEDLVMNAVIPLLLVLVVVSSVYFKLKQIQTGSTGLPSWLNWLFSPVGEEHSRDTSSHSTASRQETVSAGNGNENSNDSSRRDRNNNNNNSARNGNGYDDDDDDDDEINGDILEGFRVNVSDLEEDLDGVPLISTKKHK